MELYVVQQHLKGTYRSCQVELKKADVGPRFCWTARAPEEAEEFIGYRYATGTAADRAEAEATCKAIIDLWVAIDMAASAAPMPEAC